MIHSFVRVKNTCSFSGSFSGLGQLSSYIYTDSTCGKYLSGEKNRCRGYISNKKNSSFWKCRNFRADDFQRIKSHSVAHMNFLFGGNSGTSRLIYSAEVAEIVDCLIEEKRNNKRIASIAFQT